MCKWKAEMAADIDFASLPKHAVPGFVVSPRRILADVLSKGWVESQMPLSAISWAVSSSIRWPCSMTFTPASMERWMATGV